MQLQTAERRKVKMKCLLEGPAGSGKTYSALLIAYGLCNDWNKIAVIDTENESASLYAHLGSFHVVNLQAPFTPEKYIEAITLCMKENIEVIVVDSLSHQWQYLLDFHSNLQGNSFANWGKVSIRHEAFMQKMLQCPCHVVATVRTKQDYVLSNKTGKIVPEKVGLKAIQREGLDFEFTLVFDIDIHNHAKSSKDRTGLFYGLDLGILTSAVGTKINEWCNSGVEFTCDEVRKRIGSSKTVKDLIELYRVYPAFNEALKPEFEQRKREIILERGISENLLTPKTLSNGTH